VTVHEARAAIWQVLLRESAPEDFAAYTGLSDGVFERIVHTVEDADPHWLHHPLRDPRFDRSVRCEIAGFMRGLGANTLVLELLGEPAS